MSEGSRRIRTRDGKRQSNGMNDLRPTEGIERDPPHGRVGAGEPLSAAMRPPHPLRLLRFPAVRERTGLSRSTIWRMERRGDFPQHYRISLNAVGWAEHEIVRWIGERVGD